MSKGFVLIMNLDVKRKLQLAEELQEKKKLPMLTGKQVAFTIHAFVETKDVQRRVTGMNDLLNFGLVNDNVKKFDDAWERIPMALEKGPEDDLLEGHLPFTIDNCRSRLPCRIL